MVMSASVRWAEPSPLPALPGPLLCSLYAVISSRSWWRSPLPPSSHSSLAPHSPHQWRPGRQAGSGRRSYGPRGPVSHPARHGARPGRQCVMVMLTCPTFVIHLCDNWDRCFHVHPQCLSNQDQRLVNTVRDKRRATSPDRTTSSVDHHLTSLQLQPQPSVVWQQSSSWNIYYQ